LAEIHIDLEKSKVVPKTVPKTVETPMEHDPDARGTGQVCWIVIAMLFIVVPVTIYVMTAGTPAPTPLTPSIKHGPSCSDEE